MSRAGRSVTVVLAMVAGVLGVGFVHSEAASASTTVQDRVVSPTPVSWTPRVNDGQVDSITQVGGTVVIGGDFTSVSNSNGGGTLTRRAVAAINASTGAISSTFAPTLNGSVSKVLPGPIAGTVLVGGSFSTVNGTARRGVALLNLSNGSLVSSFTTASINGNVNDMEAVGNRLYIGGTFTTVGGQAHARLAALNLTTGAVDTFVRNQFSVNHNWYSGCSNCAHGSVQVKYLDVTADGSTLIAVGNFKEVDGYTRDQIVNIDLTGAAATVRSDWNTNAYTARCFDWAFDTYMRGLAMSADGSYFVVATTGGANGGRAGGTHCDTAARFDTADRGQDVQPTWAQYAGGDTFTAVEIAGAAVYTGGHMRWLNNDFGSDSAGPGSVPRAGLAALDPETGSPLSWNPGRNPRGYGVTALYATPDGLWLGSDTDYIGNRRYLRPKLAFFPLSGGSVLPAGQAMSLPSNVYLGGALGGTTNTNILYRFNTGGALVGAIDNGPDWLGDDAVAPYRSGASNAAAWDGGVPVDSSVPSTTPNAVFDSERWGSNAGQEMAYHLPVPVGEQVTVRLYLANRCSCTASAGQRVFDVLVDGTTVLNDYDIVADVGDQRGTVKTFPVTSDGTVDIEFGHVVENPLVNGIEIVKDGAAPAAEPGTLSRRWFDGTTASPDSTVLSNIDWATVRGAVQVDGTLFYGGTDGKLHKVSYDGQAFGTPQTLDPYHDPDWCTVATGSGTTVFCGVDPNLTMSSVTAMAYQDGRLYYTLLGQTGLFYRTFSPDSGIIGASQFQVSATLPAGSPAVLISGGSLYYADRNSGNLFRIDFSPAGTSGSATLVSGPGTDGRDWRARAVFMAPGPDGPQPPKAPVASFTASCDKMSCTFNGAASHDDDGDIVSYLWEFGDGETEPGTGAPGTVEHTFVNPGQHTVTLTVTDDSDMTGSAQQPVNPALPAPAAPVAVFSEELACAFDASGSGSGAGGLEYAWEFGDGATGTGVDPHHEYEASGTYQVRLTVTDSLGRTAQVTHGVTVSEPGDVTPIGFVSAAGANSNVTATQVVVPAATQAGDGLLAVLSLNTDASVTTPAGWTLEASGTNSGLFSHVYRRSAAAGDAGSDVRFAFSKQAKAALDLAVYRGVLDGDFVSATGAFYGSGAARQAPAAPVAVDGSWAVTWWTDKSAGTTDSWQAPGSVSVRRTSFGSGGGSLSSLLTDSGGPLSAGTYPARTATSNASSNKADAWTIVLTPATSGPPAPAVPVAQFGFDCDELACDFDASGSSTGAAGGLTYQWSYGDGASDSGVSPSHSYAAAGSYTVSLTVTDSLDRTAQVAHTVSVSPDVPAGEITFVARAGANGNMNTARVTVPASVQAGDGLVLLLSINTNAVTPATPAGWTLVDQVGTNGMQTRVYARTATAGDAGGTVVLAYSPSSYAKTAVELLAYRGVASGSFLSTTRTAFPGSGTARQAPAAAVTTAGSWVTSWWSDKSAATTTSWTLPGTVSTRGQSYGSGGGAISSAVADSAGAVPAGAYPARTATSNAAAGNATAWTLTLAPQT